MTIIDISTKTAPEQTGYLTNLSSMDYATSIFVSGDYAYVASYNNNSLTVIDISTPSSPTQVGYLTNSSSMDGVYSVHVSGDYAYVASYISNSLTIIDVADGFAQGVEINVNNVSSSELSVDDEWILGCKAYDNTGYSSWLNSSGLTIVDIIMQTSRIYSASNSTEDDLQGYCNATDASADNVSYFYEWYKDDALFSFGSLSNYTGDATQVGYLTNSSSMNGVRSVFVSGDYAYIISSDNDSLTIIDISTKTSPTQVGYLTNSSSMNGAFSIYVSGDYAYVASEINDSLTIINISTPSSPTQVGYLTNSSSLNGAFSIYVSGDYAYVASGSNDSLTVIDISTKTSPTQVGHLTNSSSLNGARSVFVLGDYAYVGSYLNNSLTIINISIPSSPTQVGYLTNSSSMIWVWSVFVSGDYAYVASFDADSLTIINVSDKASPTQVGYLTNTSMDAIRSVFVSGDYAYVASSNNDSLTVIDVSTKTSPIQVGYLTNSSSLNQAYSVYVSGDYAYVASFNNDSLTIIDVADGFTQGVEINVNNISSSHLDVDDEWILGCRAYDNTYYSSWLNSSGLILDITPPTIQVQSPTNTTYANSTIYFNATADETISTWVANYNGTNITGFTINTTLIVEDGNHHLLLYANDSAGNFGLNDSIYFTVDTTAPTATFTCSPSVVTVGETITCTCSVTDTGGSGVNTSATSYTSSPSTSNTGAFTLTCTFEDLAGNSGNSTASYTVESSEDEGGGGGAATTSTPTESHMWTEITPNQPVEMIIDDPEIDLTKITITTTETVSDASLKITKVDAVSIADLEIGGLGDTYQSFKIETIGINDTNIKEAIIEFKVNKTWIDEQGGTSDEISLYRKNETTSEWNSLATNLIDNDSDYYYFSATSPGFSIFVVVIDLSACNNNDVCETEVGEDESNCPNDCKVIFGEKGFFETIKSYLWSGIILVLVIVVILVVLIVGLKKGKQSKRLRQIMAK